MEFFENIIMLFSLLIVGYYLFVLLAWFISWKLYFKNSVHSTKIPSTKISVIVPVRNEQNNIRNCIEKLLVQDYPLALLEIIIVDDFSSDLTIDICKNFQLPEKRLKHRILFLEPIAGDERGKKAAIERGVMHALGELIITTDADCNMGSHWVKSFAEIYELKRPAMLTGFVKLSPYSTLFSAFQSLEFLSLSGSAAMTTISEKPLMCSGANLAFTKESFISSGGYNYGSGDPSGDDTYLMLKIAGNKSSDVVFNNNPDSIVSTSSMPDLQSLISQRSRWASKVKKYKEGYIKRFGLFIFIANLILILLPIFAILNHVSWLFVFVIWFIKLTADCFVLVPSAIFASQLKILLLILPAYFLYPFYAVVGTLLALSKTNYEWKGRKFK